VTRSDGVHGESAEDQSERWMHAEVSRGDAGEPAVHARDVEEVIELLETVVGSGLDQEEAQRRLARDGPNLLVSRRPPGWSARIGHELMAPMSVLLLAAAAVSGLVIGETVDGVVILAIVALNAVIGAVQEGKAADAVAALRSMETPTARVRRGGAALRLAASDLVRGDVVELAAGDRIPADLRLVEVASMEVDESLLTGESLPVAKSTAPVPADVSAADRLNMAYSGAHVVRGSGVGVVAATAGRTEMGAIAAALETEVPPTPLQREMLSVTRRLGIGAVAIAGLVFLLTLVAGGEDSTIESAFLVAVALAVAAVPEGLPTVVTIGLALGVRRMARRGAIVKRLSAVETLGSATALLTDKTGTLTENLMAMDGITLATGSPLARRDPAWPRFRRAVLVCNDATLDPPDGDPVDLALLSELGETAGELRRDALPRLAGQPFDSERRRMTVVSADDGGPFLAMKGAPEELLPRCNAYLDAAGVEQPIDPAVRDTIADGIAAWAEAGTRVLAVADRRLGDVPDDLDAAETDLVLVGLVGMADPVRADAHAAVAEARRAGIEVIMVTGDHAGTARAVAHAVGITSGDPVTGRQMRESGIPSDLHVPVYARVDPGQKLALVEEYQARGQVVAVTGDGVNDAPALRRADIGVAMGRRGSDVAKQASDLVIVDDDLSTIVAAVREGRGIYDNLRKVVDYLVAGNLSEIIVVVVSLLLGGAATTLTAVQLLWINLLTDGLPALALGVDPTAGDVMARPPRPRSQRLLGGRRLGSLGLRGLLIACGPLSAFAVSRYLLDDGPATARTVLFTTLILAHLLYAFAVRPRGLAGAAKLVLAVGLAVALQTLLVAIPAMGEVFDVGPLSAWRWVLVLAAAPAPIVVLMAMRPRESGS
jgi:Ca2+-transporting ATPase